MVLDGALGDMALDGALGDMARAGALGDKVLAAAMAFGFGGVFARVAVVTRGFAPCC